MSPKRIVLLGIVLSLIGSYFAFDLGQYLSLDYFRAQQSLVRDFHAEHPLQSALIYFVLYVLVTGLSLPGAAIMTLIGGAIFGLWFGLLLVSFASTVGATLAFLVSRFLLRDSVQQRFSRQLQAINQGVEREGAFYLFALRLVPAFPFFLINLLMGLTPMRTVTFFFVSQVGMLPGTMVFVNAGTQLGQLESLSGLVSPGLLGSFALLGIFPLIAKKIVGGIKARQVYQGYKKPREFDRNLIVIGAGSAGLVTSYIAAAVKAKVTLIEKHKMGGDCLNTGCVPSKALIKTAKTVHLQTQAEALGLDRISVEFDFARVMQRVQRVIKAIEPHDSVERYTELGVECIQGEARLVSPWEVEVNGQRLSARKIVIATGARPFIPSIAGLEEHGYLSSDNLWNMREQPRRLIVLGGGPIGCELTQAFARLGSEVTQVEMLPRLMAREDEDVSAMVEQRFLAEGVDVRCNTQAKAVELIDGSKHLICESGGETLRLPFDEILVAVGRVANTQGFGLEELGVEVDRTIKTDEFLQTNFPNIFACGDVAGPYQFTHTAAHQAWYAAVNALFGDFKRFKVDYSVIPWATFTEPEVARVGLNEQDAREKGIAYEVTRYGIDDLDRAIADEVAYGMVKVLTEPGKDRILGVTIVGDHAGDLIAEYVQAMKHNIGMNKILGTIHIYPTLAEANKFAAGEWKRAHAPETVLQWVERFHRWRR